MKGQPLKMFMHRLAGVIGRTVGELEQTMSYVELQDWLAYNALEPVGEWRADMRNAQLVKHVVDLHYWLGGKKSPHSLKDFMLFWDDAEPERETTAVEPDVEPQQKQAVKKGGAKISEELLTQLFLAGGVSKAKKKAKAH